MSLPPSYNLLKKYPNHVYVETGVWRGDSIQTAIDAGFRDITGIDIDQESIGFCKSRFDFSNPDGFRNWIKLVKGDSANCLWNVIKDIDQPITFFLDSHWQMLEGTEPGHNPFPLIQEIEQIAMHHRKDHVIIIDDCLIFQWSITGYDLNLIKTRIEMINPEYRFKMVANPVINGIMVAFIP